MTAKKLPGVTAAEWKRAQKRSEKAKQQLARIMPFEQWISQRPRTAADIATYHQVRTAYEKMAADPMQCVQEMTSVAPRRRSPRRK